MKINRRQLRSLIKEMAAKQPGELSDRFYWEVKKWSAKLSDEDEWDGHDGDKTVNNVLIAGYVHADGRSRPSRVAGIFIKQKPWSDCNHWEVKNASVSRYSDVFGDDLVDLGPMMYDIAMEIAGDDGMISDSDGTSGDAQRVWDFYLTNRVGVDVEVLDLDMTTCGRDGSSPDLVFKNKVYYKKAGSSSIIGKLKDLDKIKFENFN